jgi:methionyl-tRNA formyltransferase
MGTPAFAVPSLRALVRAGHQIELVVTQPDRPKGRSQQPQPPPVKLAALELGLPVYQPERLTAPEALDPLRAARPEAMVVVAFGHILRPEALAIPPLGCVNAHASLLPKYRGAAPIPWAIAAGETVTGVTTMLLDAGMDTGPTLLRREVPIDPEETGGSLYDRLAPVAAELLGETLAGLAAGTVTPKPQDETQATVAPMLKKEDGRVDWMRTAAEIDRRVRGLHPWPGSFTCLKGETLKVIRARPETGRRGAPGEVLACDRDGILVAAGNGAVRLIEIQPPGKKAMNACAWLAGHCLDPGCRFD